MIEQKSIFNYRITDRAHEEMVRRQITEKEIARVGFGHARANKNSS